MTETEARFAEESLLLTRLVMRSALGPAYFESELAGEPEAVTVDGLRTTFLFDGVSYEWNGERRAVLEMRHRAHFLACSVFSESGKLLDHFHQPLGDVSLN